MGIVAVIAVAVTLLFFSPTVTSAFASPLTAMSNQTLTHNDDAGVIILKGATVIDGTGVKEFFYNEISNSAG